MSESMSRQELVKVSAIASLALGLASMGVLARVAVPPTLHGPPARGFPGKNWQEATPESQGVELSFSPPPRRQPSPTLRR